MNEMLKTKGSQVRVKGQKKLTRMQLDKEKERLNEITKKYINIKKSTLEYLANEFYNYKLLLHHITDFYVLL